jgi:hypothetical protein
MSHVSSLFTREAQTLLILVIVEVAILEAPTLYGKHILSMLWKNTFSR